MIVDIVVPNLGESILEVEIGSWQKRVGESVAVDEPLVEIESEKAAVEVPSPAAGALVAILRNTGDPSRPGEAIGKIDTEQAGKAAAPPDPLLEPAKPSEVQANRPRVMPAAARVLAEKGIDASAVAPTGPGGRVLKEDAQRAAPKAAPTTAAPIPTALKPQGGTREEVRERMSLLRRTIANRLLEAKQSTAMLTTFNEIDMSAVKAMRAELGAAFLETHGIKLGFMSIFIKASVAALRNFPNLNARIEGDEIVHALYYDIGVAIGGGRGLVVPVIRNAETLGFADIERFIADYGLRAKANTLTLEELTGGTFSISNGGVYGSLLSTPILNPPQSGILGLHAIKDRPVVVDKEIVIRPMMNVALSYDHRIVDGREAVTFLKSVKERVENPEKLLLEI